MLKSSLGFSFLRSRRRSIIQRREFLIGSSFLIAATKLGTTQMAHLPPVAPAPPLLVPEKMAPYVDPLPILEVAKPMLVPRHGPPASRYRIPISEFHAQIHRDLPPTRFWGYGNSVPGPTIEVRSGEEIAVEWPNQLPAKHFLPIDHNIMGAEVNVPESRAVVHVHGAKVPPDSDGYPEDWYAPGKSLTYTYPNQQDAALLWYHDHAMGINRLNICAGMAGLYIIRDAVEDALNLPQGEFEIPLVLMDRMITAQGRIYYPVSQLKSAPWVPEYMGNVTLMNGKVLPYLTVQPRKYRFRMLNASNARFYFLSLSNGRPFQQIGSDQGLLPAPTDVKRLELAPGERADFVIDFSTERGQKIVLQNLTTPLMQFQVSPNTVNDPSSLPSALRPVAKTPLSAGVLTRRLSLMEIDNTVDEPMVHLLDGKHWHDPISEKPVLDSTEIWEFLNTTDDSHPIHLHLVRFQILDRRPIDIDDYIYGHKVTYVGDAVLPEPNEAGWKDTVVVTPGSSTRIIAKFEGYPGRYVWHCHILEHEDNEMMRPYEVVTSR